MNVSNAEFGGHLLVAAINRERVAALVDEAKKIGTSFGVGSAAVESETGYVGTRTRERGD